MANTATITGRIGPAFVVTAVVFNNVRGFSVDFNGYVFTLVKEDGTVLTIDIATATVTITTAVNATTKVNSITVSVTYA